MSSSNLQAYVNEQKKAKSSSWFLGSVTPSDSLSNIRSKIASGINGLSTIARGQADQSDLQALVVDGDDGGPAQLPSAKNRRSSGFFSAFSTEESLFGMSRMQRIIAFFMAIIGAFVCFSMSIMLLPIVVIQARKFAALNTLGSVMLILSFAFLWGPVSYMKHMLSEQRRTVTAAYLTTVLATLYFSLWLRNTIITIVCAVLQAVTLIWFILSYAPGGERGLRFLAGLLKGFCISKTATVLPI